MVTAGCYYKRMAFGQLPIQLPPSLFFQPPVQFDRARAEQPLPAVPESPERGSLVIVDDFQDTSLEASHGNVAAFAARQHGFRGEIYAERIGPDNRVSHPAWDSYSSLQQGPLSPEQARGAVEEFASKNQSTLLGDVTGDLDKIRERGLTDSAVNVSYGTHPQNVADNLYRTVRSAPRGSMFAQNGQAQRARNVMNAYGIDQATLDNPDTSVSGPERLRLQQALLDAAQRGAETPDVLQAKEQYGEAVRALEANNNSVVVSAGNQGTILDDWARDAGGLRVNAAPDSNHNVLVNSDVTTVGATRWFNNGTERIADYSTPDPEVDIHASGSVGNGEDQNRMKTLGTSFASPRVAGAMAALHGNYPGMPSSAVENLMRNRLTHEVEGQPTLSFQLAEEYMRQGTF